MKMLFLECHIALMEIIAKTLIQQGQMLVTNCHQWILRCWLRGITTMRGLLAQIYTYSMWLENLAWMFIVLQVRNMKIRWVNKLFSEWSSCKVKVSCKYACTCMCHKKTLINWYDISLIIITKPCTGLVLLKHNRLNISVYWLFLYKISWVHVFDSISYNWQA